MKPRTALATAGALAVVGALVAPVPASADGVCDDNHFCLYEDDDYHGQRAQFDIGTGPVDLTKVRWAGGNSYVTDGASSMKNLTGHTVHLYDAADCSGGSGYDAKPHSVDTDLTNNWFDNTASCLQFS
ncbi:peptidase inhibitor family I36 protein [Actinokineospora enzanensis]|uniref:peptidase inhibitor family I36 protein n=1 Tax=Actinokineospora enzanensis TaxID=155975 RepID=UPI0003609A52|nr:peptidase inhibitor family I36 protein [Actinokineospora enzanensis]